MAEMKEFDMFGRLNEEKDRKLRVNKKSNGLKTITEFYENQFTKIKPDNKVSNHDSDSAVFSAYAFENLENIVKTFNYETRDIIDFCEELPHVSSPKIDKYTGVYISALINQKAKIGEEIFIDFSHLYMVLDYIGAYLNKDIALKVKGEFGDFVGMDMKKGTLIIDGNVDHQLGSFMGSKKDSPGRIIQKGNAGGDVGYFMEGGTIEIYGSYENISWYAKGGKIYCNGKLVLGKPSKIEWMKKKYKEVLKSTKD